MCQRIFRNLISCDKELHARHAGSDPRCAAICLAVYLAPTFPTRAQNSAVSGQFDRAQVSLYKEAYPLTSGVAASTRAGEPAPGRHRVAQTGIPAPQAPCGGPADVPPTPGGTRHARRTFAAVDGTVEAVRHAARHAASSIASRSRGASGSWFTVRMASLHALSRSSLVAEVPLWGAASRTSCFGCGDTPGNRNWCTCTCKSKDRARPRSRSPWEGPQIQSVRPASSRKSAIASSSPRSVGQTESSTWTSCPTRSGIRFTA